MAILELFTKKRVCHLLVNLEGEVAEKYQYFMEFLASNRAALAIISELEQLYYRGEPFTMAAVQMQYRDLMDATRNLVEALNGLAAGKYAKLSQVYERLNLEVARVFAPQPRSPAGELVLPLEALDRDLTKIAGAKATNLALMHKFLNIPIPPGFVITVQAMELFFQETGLAEAVAKILAGLSPERPGELAEKSRALQEMILRAQVPATLAEKIRRAYQDLEARTYPRVRLAMRSSAIGEDTEASFAGQYSTELNVTREELLEAYKKVLASKYSPRAILYRRRCGLEDRDTHMCVAGIVMINSRASGVLYTMDPTRPESDPLKINSIWGLGEYLVSGEALADEFKVDRSTGALVQRNLNRKAHRLVNLEEGGTRLEEVPEGEQSLPSLDDDTVQALAHYGQKLEGFFQGPQDVEWAVDQEGKLFILQSRPLTMIQAKPGRELPREFPNHPVLLSGGQAASPGIAVGRVFRADGDPARPVPDDAILVARTASPDYARLLGQVRGIITDTGSVTSHLASVARESDMPALFDTGQATALLAEGEPITLVADRLTVYRGLITELASAAKPPKRPIFASPQHRRLRTLLDQVAVLNLTDPRDPAFSTQGCRTIHDIVRFAHEMVMQEMFGLSREAAGKVISVKLTTDIPLTLYLIDLGGGLQGGLTTCDTVTADHLASIPMQALWKGFSHPGITWSGAIPMDTKNLMHLMVQGALSGPGNLPGGESYAILSREYLNLSAKFGYHFANLDAFCSYRPEQNYLTLQFAGGAGTYYGKTLRLNFLGNVLSRLGFKIQVSGDLLEASLTGYDLTAMEHTLDQVGRLLASSRLLDMAIGNEAEMNRAIQAFFAGDYDFLRQAQEIRLPGFYTHTGNWRRVEEGGRVLLLQDGSDYGSALSSGLANFMGRVMGAKYWQLLDNIEAYFYFPLAIAKDSEVSDGVIKVRVKPMAGSIDQAGGLAFAIRNINNYFVLRVNALEDNVILFEYVNGRRLQRAAVNREIRAGEWYLLSVEIAGDTLKGYLNEALLLEYQADRPLPGYVGLWTKADSVTSFEELLIEEGGKKRLIEF
jgi:pyruvate, water dikinase